MRVGSFLMALCFFVVILVGFQLVATQVRANSVTADVDVDPDALLLKDDGYGKWITVYIGLPEGYDVNDINVSSITLEVLGGHVPVSKYDIQRDILMVKFDRALVISFLWSMIEHMTPHVKSEVTLTVTGNLYDDGYFEGSDTIKVFYTHL